MVFGCPKEFEDKKTDTWLFAGVSPVHAMLNCRLVAFQHLTSKLISEPIVFHFHWIQCLNIQMDRLKITQTELNTEDYLSERHRVDTMHLDESWKLQDFADNIPYPSDNEVGSIGERFFLLSLWN